MKNTRLHHTLDDRGQTLVEFALIVLLLLVILFGIAEFGRAWFYSNHLTNATRAAARYGAVLRADTVGELKTAVDTYLRDEIGFTMDPDVLESDDIAINVFPPPPSATPKGDGLPVEKNDIIKVSVSYDFRFLVGSYFLDMFNKEGVWTLERSASMQYEESN